MPVSIVPFRTASLSPPSSRAWLALSLAGALAACSGSNPDGADRHADAMPEAPVSASPPGAGADALPAEAKPGEAPPGPEAEDGAPDARVADAEATVGGDGSGIRLSTLSAAEIDAATLEGELACSFSQGDAAPLLLAKGDVGSAAPARGVVKVGDYVEAVAAPGGFDAMSKGASFSGAGKTIRIELTGPAAGGGESPPRPATLTYDRADGARRVFSGQWRCGP